MAADTLERILNDVQHDWRVQSLPVKHKLQVAVWGMGSSEYDTDTMGRPARECVRQFQKLGAKCLLRLRVGDDAVRDHAVQAFQQWKKELERKLKIANVVFKKMEVFIRTLQAICVPAFNPFVAFHIPSILLPSIQPCAIPFDAIR